MRSSKDRYSGEIKVLFPVYGKAEKDFLKQLVVRINEFSNDNEEAEYEDYLEEFGMPKEIVSAYYESIEFEYLLHKMKVRNMIKKAVFIIMTILTLLCIWFSCLFYIGYIDSKENKITETEITITEESK